MIRMTKDINEATLITHSSKFHADDVFATAFMGLVLGDAVVIRVNEVDPNYNGEAIIYDIGFGKFDHHQKDFDLRHEVGVKYASFGLLFKEYGYEYLKRINPEFSESVYSMIENDLILSIDAVDNGEFPVIDCPYNYKSIDGIIADFNSCWNEDVDNDINFLEAVNIATFILGKIIKRCFAKALSKRHVEEAIEKSSNHIMVLNEYMPFKDFVLSSNNPKALDILFCITPSNRGGYNIHTIPKEKNTYITRCDFPKSWGGLIDFELQEVSGVKSAKFCHSSLFLAVCLELEDAYLMANKAIENMNSTD